MPRTTTYKPQGMDRVQNEITQLTYELIKSKSDALARDQQQPQRGFVPVNHHSGISAFHPPNTNHQNTVDHSTNHGITAPIPVHANFDLEALNYRGGDGGNAAQAAAPFKRNSSPDHTTNHAPKHKHGDSLIPPEQLTPLLQLIRTKLDAVKRKAAASEQRRQQGQNHNNKRERSPSPAVTPTVSALLNALAANKTFSQQPPSNKLSRDEAGASNKAHHPRHPSDKDIKEEEEEDESALANQLHAEILKRLTERLVEITGEDGHHNHANKRQKLPDPGTDTGTQVQEKYAHNHNGESQPRTAVDKNQLLVAAAAVIQQQRQQHTSSHPNSPKKK